MNDDKYLEMYTDKQIENWKSSDKIIICQGREQLREFIEAAKENNLQGKKIYLGIVNDSLAEKVMNEFKINIDKYNCAIRADEVRKILKKHGDGKIETLRGQQKVVESDFERIPEIIAVPDIIEYGGEYYNKPVLKFSKNEYTIVGIVSRKHLDLYAQTMYIRKKNKSLATTPGDEKILPHTSETLSGTASKNSITKNDKKTI